MPEKKNDASEVEEMRAIEKESVESWKRAAVEHDMLQRLLESSADRLRSANIEAADWLRQEIVREGSLKIHGLGIDRIDVDDPLEPHHVETIKVNVVRNGELFFSLSMRGYPELFIVASNGIEEIVRQAVSVLHQKR